VKLTLAQLIGEIITDTKIICDNCGWSWNKEDGGDDLYMCHKCDHNNTPHALEYSGGADTAWEDDKGNKVTLQDILDMTKNIPIKDYPTEKLAKIVLNWDDNPEEVERIKQVEISKQYPILIMIDASGKIQWILDGNHRAQKALRSKAKTIPAKLIKPSNLDDKAKRILLGTTDENFKDGKVKEVFTPSPLQNLVNDYLFLVTLNFTHIEKTGKTPKDVDALTQMIRHAKSDVSKLKDLSKEQLEKNRNNILQRIHDMLTYIISRMKAHMRPEEYEKRRGRLNKLLTLYKDAASVKENYADGKVKGKSRPGRVKKSGASCKGSVTDLRRKAKNASGEKAKMYHWCANMKGGKK
jgi:hypothetical protein